MPFSSINWETVLVSLSGIVRLFNTLVDSENGVCDRVIDGILCMNHQISAIRETNVTKFGMLISVNHAQIKFFLNIGLLAHRTCKSIMLFS